MIQIEEDKLYKISEVAKILNWHPNTVRVKVTQGEIKGVNIGSNTSKYATWRVKGSDIQYFINKN